MLRFGHPRSGAGRPDVPGEGLALRYLFVGDPHAEVHDLDDCLALAKYVLQVAQETGATVVLAGDLYHTHAIIHAEVQFFWYAFFETLRRKGVPCIVLKGNHDMPGLEGSRATALVAHVAQCTTVLYGPYAVGGVLFCPYTKGPQLAEWSQAHPECRTLFCHQTFNGSKYENGFFAGDGVDPDAILQEQVISGHIHAPQEFGKVWYPGAPRWRTLSDANTDRALWMLNFNTEGKLLDRTPYDTGKVCRQIFHFVDTPDAPVSFTPVPNAVYYVDIHGPLAWIEERKPVFKDKARVRTVKTDARTTMKVRESEGVAVAFDKWVDVFEPKHGTERATLRKLAQERVHGL